MLRKVTFLWPCSIRIMLIFLLLVVLLPVLIVQSGIYYGRFQAMRAQELQANLELAQGVATTFDAYIQDLLRQTATIGVALTNHEAHTPDEMGQMLSAAVDQYPTVRNFSWVDPQGRVVASSQANGRKDFSTGAFFNEILAGKEWIVSDLLQGQSNGEATFVIARGIRDPSGKLLGVVAGMVAADRLGSVLSIQRAERGAIVVIDGRGQGVYRFPELPMTWEQRDWIKNQPIIARALAGEEVVDTFTALLDGSHRYAGWVPIRSLGWVASAIRPETEIMAPLIRDLLRDGGLLLIVGMGAFLLALLAGRALVEPVRLLREHARAVGEGNYALVHAGGPTEVIELAKTFNVMTDLIKSHEEELHAQNEELQQQRKELQSQNEELHSQQEELQAQNDELNAQAQELNRLQVAREDYIRAVSHDLRSPLSIVHAQSQALEWALERAGIVDGLPKRCVSAIQTSSRRMNSMIEDLLDIARIESGQVHAEVRPVDLPSLLRGLLERMAGVPGTERIRLTVSSELQPVLADPTALERISANLLTNALKYSKPETEVTVSLACSDGEASVTISDRGEGIPADELPRLFDRYYRSAKMGAGREGLGLGLFIAKGLVEANGGHITAESKVGEGSTFRFTVPLARVE